MPSVPSDGGCTGLHGLDCAPLHHWLSVHHTTPPSDWHGSGTRAMSVVYHSSVSLWWWWWWWWAVTAALCSHLSCLPACLWHLPDGALAVVQTRDGSLTEVPWVGVVCHFTGVVCRAHRTPQRHHPRMICCGMSSRRISVRRDYRLHSPTLTGYLQPVGLWGLSLPAQLLPAQPP